MLCLRHPQPKCRATKLGQSLSQSSEANDLLIPKHLLLDISCSSRKIELVKRESTFNLPLSYNLFEELLDGFRSLHRRMLEIDAQDKFCAKQKNAF